MDGFNEKLIAEQSKPRRTLSERVRRGTCLLNAAQYDEAIAELGMAVDAVPDSRSLSSISASWFNEQVEGGRPDQTFESLRGAIAADSENAELHFQLGAMLAATGRFEEAELRFVQTLSIARDHVEALVSVALCHQRRFETGLAIAHIRRAQALRPCDAKIALLLAQLAKISHEQGETVDLCAMVTND